MSPTGPPEDLETLLAQALDREARSRVPDGSGRPEIAWPVRRRPRRRWPAPIATAAAVAVLAMGAVAVQRSAPVEAPGPAPTQAPATTASTRPTSVSTTTAPALENLVITPEVRAQLVQAYVSHQHYQPGWITGTEPGSVYYARDPSTGTTYAWAGFTPSADAPVAVQVALQDEGSRVALRQASGGTWQVYDICTTPAFLAFVGGVLPNGGHC